MNKFLMRLALVLLGGLIGAAVYAGGQSEKGASAGGKVVSIWTYTLNQPVIDYLNKFGEKYPGYTVKLTQYETEQLKTQTKVAAAANSAPDLFYTNEGFDFWAYVKAGQTLNLTDAAKKLNWYDRSYKEFIASDTDANGQLWGMPFSTLHLWQVLFTNDDFLKANNITVPKTVDDFLKIVSAVKSAGMQPISFGDSEGWPAILMIGDYFLQTAGPEVVGQINSGKVTWTTSDAARNAVQAMVKLAQGGAFITGWQSINHEAAIASWAGKKAAFLYNGTWWPMVTNKTDLGFKIGVVPLPTVAADTTLHGTQFWTSTNIVISSQTKDKDGAIKLMDYYTTPESMELQVKMQSGLASDPRVNDLLPSLHILPDFMSAAPLTVQTTLPKMGYFDHAFPIPVEEALKVQLQKAMLGLVTVDQALQAVQAVQQQASSGS